MKKFMMMGLLLFVTGIVIVCKADDRALFSAYPGLRMNLPHVMLGNLPTAVQPLHQLAGALHTKTRLYIKRDDAVGGMMEGKQLFGGNKVRKLEFLLADAMRNGARNIFTYGCVGSNHATATAAYCKQLNLPCTVLLKDQPSSWVVRRNLLLMQEYGAQIEFFEHEALRTYHGMELRHKGLDWYEIPTGGSSPVGIIGFVNAVFELRDQIRAGLLPEPHFIYVASGSLGTITGLLLGIKAAQLSTKVIGVAVEPDLQFYKIRTLFNRANIILMQCDPEFPCCDIAQSDIHIRSDFAGEAYGQPTVQADEAIALMRNTEHIVLDPTYTGKACAALIHDIRQGCLENMTVLFWNTFCADVDPVRAEVTSLPQAVRSYVLSCAIHDAIPSV